MTKQSPKQPAIYILSNKKDGVIYTGVTSNIFQRTWQHKNKTASNFPSKYNCTNLVYYEIYEDMENAIAREKQIKASSRQKKIALIEKLNPEWRDLYQDIAK